MTTYCQHSPTLRWKGGQSARPRTKGGKFLDLPEGTLIEVPEGKLDEAFLVRIGGIQALPCLEHPRADPAVEPEREVPSGEGRRARNKDLG